MNILEVFLLVGLVVLAISVSFTKKLLTSVIIFMSFSTIMAVVWILLKSPDLAITEAAVGAGVTSILFFLTLKRIKAIDEDEEERDESKEK